jgi:acetylornithine deacetylase
LRELIAIPSVNPAFLSKGDPRTGEGSVAAWISDCAIKAGLEVDLQPVAPGRTNVLARIVPPGSVQRRILLAPHMDTVGEPNLDEQLKPRLAGGRIFGRGACDTKGCIATMFGVLAKIAAKGARPAKTEIILAALVDEENFQLGSRHYAKHGERADLAIVGEPTQLEVISAHKGDVWLQLRTEGRSAHGATPHLGVSAVRSMARVVETLEGEYRDWIALRSHPLLGCPTINVGSIAGGRQPNIVPADCIISIDRRTLPGETEEGVKTEIGKFLAGRGWKVSFDNLRTAPCPPLETDPGLPLVRELCRAARRRQTRGAHYFCDAAPLAAGGNPSVVFGPGDIAQAHTSNEWIAVDQIERAALVLEKFLRAQP